MAEWPRIITDPAVPPDEAWFVKTPIRFTLMPTASGFTVTKHYELLGRITGVSERPEGETA